jgi:uncharacterized protein YlaN (UPF0358 family)
MVKLNGLLGKFSETREKWLEKPVELPAPPQPKHPLGDEHQELLDIKLDAGKIGGLLEESYFEQMATIQVQISEVNAAVRLGVVDKKHASELLAELEEKYATLGREAKAHDFGGAGAVELLRQVSDAPNKAMQFVKDQFAGIATGTLGLAAGLPIAGGLFGLLMYGVTEKDRMAVQAGELTNIMSASGRSVSSSFLQFYASFQENAQQFMGMSRSDVQSIISTLVQSGAVLDGLSTNWHSELGVVGHDVITMSLAFDKLFEEATGTTISEAIETSRNYGVSLESATLSMIKIGFSASKAGTSISGFMKYVTDLEPQLRYYRADAESIAALTISLQEEYENAGMVASVAMATAKQGMQQISQGLSNLSIGVKAHVGEQLGLGDGVDAAYALTDSIKNADSQMFFSTLKQIASLAEKETKGTGTELLSPDDKIRYYLENQLGMGFEGALALSKILKMQSSQAKLGEVEASDWALLRDSFKTEAEKQSELEKDKNEILKGMANVGQGMLGTLLSFSGFAIIAIKGLFSMQYGDWNAMLANFGGQALSAGLGAIDVDITSINFVPRSAQNLAVYQKEQEFFNQMGDQFHQVVTGTSMIGNGIGKIAYPLIVPLLKALGYKSGWTSIVGQAAGQTIANFDAAVAKAAPGVYKTLADAPKKLVQADGKYTAYAPAGSTLVETKKMPVTYEQVRAAVAEAFKQVTGAMPSEELADTLAAQAWFESGQTGGLYNYNFGGVKGKGTTGQTALFATHEVINGETLAVKDFFRAYETLLDGAIDYVKILKGRYQSAIDAAQHGDVEGYVHKLKERGYFTGDEAKYKQFISSIIKAHQKPKVNVTATMNKTPDGNEVRVVTQISH